MEEILATKLFIPAVRPELVPRPRLIEQLNDGLHCKLTLISAPAGFGKTTLLCEWVDCCGRTAAWISLDENDNDWSRFLSYFIAALDKIDANITGGEFSKLQSPQPPPVETTLTSLINKIAAFPDKLVILLDDYHLIESQVIHDALSFLIDNQPPNFHLVIATREDPFLPLSRLRARGQLAELRAADLRFTSSEAAEFLNQVMGLDLSAEDIAALESRTEGWIAGLQLAAISMQKLDETTNFIKTFTGSNRLVLDYLIDEVLNRQPEDIQSFLLRTSILNRLTGTLCDAITGQQNGQTTLELLERSNLFIVPLDNERRWYRYHHLFVDLLRARLRQIRSEGLPALHLSASEWYEQNELWSDAIRHAFAAKNLNRAADLIALAWHPMNKSYQSMAWLGWAKALPDELVRSRPVLSTACGWAHLDTGDLEAAELHFQNAERWLEATGNVNEQFGSPSGKMAALNEDELRSLLTSIANGRAYLAQALGDVTGTVKYTQRATELLREDDYFEHGLSDVLAGFAYWADGNLEAAHGAVVNAISNMQMTGRMPFVISFTSYLSDIMTTQGQLHETEKTYLQLLETVMEQCEAEVRETAVLHLGLSELYLEQGDMESAKQHLQRSEDLGELPEFPPWYRHWIYAHARMMEARGDLDSVIEMLSEAERLYYRHPIPDVHPLPALMAWAWLAQGNLTEPLHWVREQDLSINDDLSYLREFEHIILARLLIAQYKSDRTDGSIHDAMRLLDRLLKAAKEGGRMGSVIEILVLQALASEAQKDIPSALLSLKRAFTLAEPEGYVQTFVREGAPMEALIKIMEVEDGRLGEYLHKLLASFGDQKKSSSLSAQPLIEPLSERELEILQLIAEGLTNQEIGSQLYLSLNTVKAHTRNIYGKLGVNSRTQAAARGRTLGILQIS